MTNQNQYPRWLFILFPSITMLLGWGLRGYIGGGPFGAMIPGAMVALSLAMLLKLSVETTSVLVVFAAVGIGLGGEMTYGQTLGFLRNPETMWWGTLGTTVKGAVWGLLGGTVLALGLIYKKLSAKTIIVAYLLMLAGMLAGFKLINQPMLVYFSDPEKPRPESWGALLIGALAMLAYLKYKLESVDFKIIARIALWGLIGGGLGFGLGGFWMVMGSYLSKDVIFDSWWKAMEFTFGMLFGASLGLAVWLSRKEIDLQGVSPSAEPSFASGQIWKEAALTLLLALLIFWVMPEYLDQIVDEGYTQGSFVMLNGIDLAKMLSNFAFYGFILILAVIRFPNLAWQVGITLTFCYAAIDFMQEFYPEVPANSPFTSYFLLIFLMILIVGLLTAYFQRRPQLLRNMFLLLVWSCMVVAFLRLGFFEKASAISGLSVAKLIVGKFFVHIVFALSAWYISWVSIRKMNESNLK
jgi:hypothetical protein